MLGSLRGIETLECYCDKRHEHIADFGSVKIGNRRVVRAAAAGAYPFPLCRALAKLVHAALQ